MIIVLCYGLKLSKVSRGALDLFISHCLSHEPCKLVQASNLSSTASYTRNMTIYAAEFPICSLLPCFSASCFNPFTIQHPPVGSRKDSLTCFICRVFVAIDKLGPKLTVINL